MKREKQDELNASAVGKKVARIEFDGSDYILKSLYPDDVSEVRIVFEDGSALRFTASDMIDDNSVSVEFMPRADSANA